MITQIEEMFKEIDKDNSGNIDKKELNNSLLSIGINLTVDELNSQFNRFDKNTDGTISFNEFRDIMEEKIVGEMMNADDLIHDIRNEFKKVDINRSRMINKRQLWF